MLNLSARLRTIVGFACLSLTVAVILAFSSNAYAACCQTVFSCRGLAPDVTPPPGEEHFFEWQTRWGKLVNEKIPADNHDIKRSINTTYDRCGVKQKNFKDILAFEVDYSGDGILDYVLDSFDFYAPDKFTNTCPVQICRTESNCKTYCGVGFFRRMTSSFFVDDDCDLSTLDQRIQDFINGGGKGTPPCSVDECPEQWIQRFHTDATKWATREGWCFVDTENYVDQIFSSSDFFRPFVVQFYKELEDTGVLVFDNKTREQCINEALAAIAGNPPQDPQCKRFPDSSPNYAKPWVVNKNGDREPTGEMDTKIFVLKIDSPLDQCSPEELLLWSNVYGCPRCIKFYQFRNDTFVDLYEPKPVPLPMGPDNGCLVHWRFPLTPIPYMVFRDNSNCRQLIHDAETTEDILEVRRLCPWRGWHNIEVTYAKDEKGNDLNKPVMASFPANHPTYNLPSPPNTPFDPINVKGAIAFQFINDETKEFYCRDIKNIGDKQYLIPARTDKELMSFMEAFDANQVEGLTHLKWASNVDPKQPDSCERRIYGYKEDVGQGYWRGTVFCPPLECQSSVTISAERWCMRSTGLQCGLEDCTECLKKFPDLLKNLPGPANVNPPAGNQFTGTQGMCKFRRLCVNNTPCNDHHSCLPATAKVLMADGSLRPIIEVNVDDMVMGFKGAASALEPVKVSARFITEDQVYMKINDLEITGAHTLPLPGGTTALARTLKVGDKIVNAKGKVEVIKTITAEAGKASVYNLSLDGADGFVANGVRIMAKEK
ncbi:MAG: Hint domain-containing protein [Alphaproteobacteria bacterium]|nr:Hint domain-containing protein [Alphaproteobacteria bacterium]